MEDLPGHADEVFAVDWSPTGIAGASGGKDRVLKMYVFLFLVIDITAQLEELRSFMFVDPQYIYVTNAITLQTLH